jgi:hypothetical protein
MSKEKKRFKPNKAVIIIALVFITFTILTANLWMNPREESIVEEYDILELDESSDTIQVDSDAVESSIE